MISFRELTHNFWYKLDREEKLVVLFPIAILLLGISSCVIGG